MSSYKFIHVNLVDDVCPQRATYLNVSKKRKKQFSKLINRNKYHELAFGLMAHFEGCADDTDWTFDALCFAWRDVLL